MSPDGAEGKTFSVPELTLDTKKAGALGTAGPQPCLILWDSRDIRLVLMMGSPMCSRPPPPPSLPFLPALCILLHLSAMLSVGKLMGSFAVRATAQLSADSVEKNGLEF